MTGKLDPQPWGAWEQRGMRDLPTCGAVLIVAVILAVGCSTSYQAKGFSGGYSETQLSPDTWQVRFSGNAATSRERAADFLLLRAAEIMLEHGFKYFTLEDADSWIDTSVYTTPVYTVGDNVHGGQTNVYNKPRAEAVIVGVEEYEDGVLDAEFLKASLTDKYGL